MDPAGNTWPNDVLGNQTENNAMSKHTIDFVDFAFASKRQVVTSANGASARDDVGWRLGLDGCIAFKLGGFGCWGLLVV